MTLLSTKKKLLFFLKIFLVEKNEFFQRGGGNSGDMLNMYG